MNTAPRCLVASLLRCSQAHPLARISVALNVGLCRSSAAGLIKRTYILLDYQSSASRATATTCIADPVSLFGLAQRPTAVTYAKNGFGGCLRAPRTPSVYATEPMEWVGERTAGLPEILGGEGQNG